MGKKTTKKKTKKPTKKTTKKMTFRRKSTKKKSTKKKILLDVCVSCTTKKNDELVRRHQGGWRL